MPCHDAAWIYWQTGPVKSGRSSEFTWDLDESGLLSLIRQLQLKPYRGRSWTCQSTQTCTLVLIGYAIALYETLLTLWDPYYSAVSIQLSNKGLVEPDILLE